MSCETDKSVRKSWILMELIRRNERGTGVADGRTGVSKMDRTAKWSDGEDGRQETVGVMPTGVISRSRMLPSVWVGNVTCWVRLKSESLDRN